MKKIIFAGGCFWGVQAYFNALNGVHETRCGYVNGNSNNPNYEDLKAGKLTHAEAVEISYDETIIDLVKLLEHLLRFIDPTSLNKQGADEGVQYRSGIYYEELASALIVDAYLESIALLYSDPIVVEVLRNSGFYEAEEYHQDYLVKNPSGYCHVDLKLIKDNEKK